MNVTPVLLLLIASQDSAAPIADAPSTVAAYAGNACVDCHQSHEGRMREIVRNWTNSVHFNNNVACQGCHGGDATLTRDAFASDEEFAEASHASFNPEFRFLQSRRGAEVNHATEGTASFACRECHVWSVEEAMVSPHGEVESSTCLFKRFGGVAMTRERGVAYICAQCHPRTTEKQLASPHGSRGAPSCLFCHGDGTHAIGPATVDIIDPRPREERGRCTLCHKSDTMNAVAHVRDTLDETDKLLRESAEQNEQLRKMGYRNLALGEMHQHVTETRATLRQVQHGCNLREINELAKSIENVAKRTAYDYELVAALRDARRRQTRIAIGVSGLLLLLAAMLMAYRKVFCVHFGPWTTRDPVRRNITPPCVDACPAGNNIQGFIAAAVNEDYDRAFAILLETTPLPGVCGRVCPAPCMNACNRRLYDESINIRELERYVADHGQCDDPRASRRGRRVAVVGSGPAGLSATHQLVRLGYDVTVLEEDDQLGGVLRNGIPAYRLPYNVLDREIGRVIAHNVTVRTGRRVTRDDLVDFAEEYDAVFVATGLQSPRDIDLGETTPDAVLQGVRFLENARRGQVALDGKTVVVIGGGNVAIDVARTAIRLSARSVHVYCLETRARMPALVEEIEEAIEEGIEIHNGWGPLRVNGGRRPVERIEFRRCISVFDEHGEFAPTFDETRRTTIDTDTVILALGQAPDRSILPNGADIQEGCAMFTLTGAPIFIGGDFAANRGTVTAAIGSGRRAAMHIHHALTGEDLLTPGPPPIATPGYIKMHTFAHAPRRKGQILAPDARRTGFAELYAGLADTGQDRPALAEAGRCFSCGVCNQCDRCVKYCPEGIVARNGESHLVANDFCKGCGVCAAECPRGVIQMMEQP